MPDQNTFSFARVIDALHSELPSEVLCKFSLTLAGYPHGTLGDPPPPAGSLWDGKDMEVRTVRLAEFVQLLRVVLQHPDLHDIKPSVSFHGWVWGDYFMNGVPDPVHMAAPLFTLYLDHGRRPASWRKMEGAEELATMPYGSDPRASVPPLDWLGHVQKVRDIKDTSQSRMLSGGFSPQGVSIEGHSAADAKLVEIAYGPIWDLPECKITRTERGPKNNRVYVMDVEIPSVRPLPEVIDDEMSPVGDLAESEMAP